MLNQNQLKTALSIIEFFLGLAQPTCSVYVSHVSGLDHKNLSETLKHCRLGVWLEQAKAHIVSLNTIIRESLKKI